MDKRYSKNHILILQDLRAYVKLSSPFSSVFQGQAMPRVQNLKAAKSLKVAVFVNFFVAVVVSLFVCVFLNYYTRNSRIKNMSLYVMEWKEDLGGKVLGIMIPHSIPSLTTDLLGP